MSSASVDGVCAMLNHASALLEQDFREILYSRLRAGFPVGFDFTAAYNLVQSSIQQGKLQSSDTETQKAKQAFLVSQEHFLLLKHLNISRWQYCMGSSFTNLNRRSTLKMTRE